MPTAGPIVAGEQVQGEESAVYAPPDPPTPGDEPIEIVDGFIDAMGSYEPEYEVAREYLTSEANASWDPTAGATVYEGAKPAMDEIDEGRVKLTQGVVGTLGKDGAYTARPAESRTIEIQLQQVDGEWRVSTPPDGVLISDLNFRRVYRAYDLYFYDPTLQVLVPDPVYIPRAARAPATQLARSLLEGPTDRLAPAVKTAFPPGATLGVDSVPVNRGTATVELGPEARTTSPEERAAMAAQLAWTLTGVTGVERVEITAGDTPLTSGDWGTVSEDDYRDLDPSVTQAGLPVYAMSADGAVQLDGADWVPLAGPLGAATDLRAIAVDPAGEHAVVVDDAGTTLSLVVLDGRAEPVPLLTGVDLTSLSWDRRDTVWALGLDDSGQRLPIASVGGTEVPVSVAELGKQSVQQLVPSPDGTRVAVVIGDRAYIGLVIRDADASSPVQITERQLLPTPGDVIDVAWRSAREIAVLVEEETEAGVEQQIWEVPLNGTPPMSRGAVAGAVSIAGMPENPLVVATAEGTLMRQDAGVRWVEFGQGLSAPAYPQR